MGVVIEPVARIKVSDAAAAQLEQLIFQGSYAVGDKLPAERALAEQFGIGRSSMREGIKVLESEGLLESVHGRGVFVTSSRKRSGGLADWLVFDDFTMSDLLEVRRALERDAAGFAAKRASHSQVDGLFELLAMAGREDCDDPEFVRLDVRFHQAISLASKNPLLHRLYEPLGPLMEQYSGRVITVPGRRAVAHAGHMRIAEAIGEHRVEDAKMEAVRHIGEVEKDIARLLKDRTAQA